MTSPDSPASSSDASLGGAGAPTVVGYVELRASWPIYADSVWDCPDLDADETLDVILDSSGHVDVVLEALERGITVLTVQYRGGEATERTPR